MASAAVTPRKRGAPASLRSRAKKRKLTDKYAPDLAEGEKRKDLVHTVSCTLASKLAGDLQNGLFRGPILQVVSDVNKIRKQVSMLAKELVLFLLGNDRDLPEFTQSFFSGLFTALKRGTWGYGADSVPILERHRKKFVKPQYSRAVNEAMATVALQMAAAVEVHYRLHHDGFRRRAEKAGVLQSSGGVCDDDAEEADTC